MLFFSPWGVRGMFVSRGGVCASSSSNSSRASTFVFSAERRQGEFRLRRSALKRGS